MILYFYLLLLFLFIILSSDAGLFIVPNQLIFRLNHQVYSSLIDSSVAKGFRIKQHSPKVSNQSRAFLILIEHLLKVKSHIFALTMSISSSSYY